jgi:hypothetical protein
MPVSYKNLTREIERLVREVELGMLAASDFPAQSDLFRRALQHRAKGFIYSGQLVGGYLTECDRYVQAGRFGRGDSQLMLGALVRLHAAADFEAKS